MASLSDRLVVVRMGAIGDVVNALVFASAVRQHAPGARIGWVVHDLARPLVEGHPCVDRVHVWKRGGGLAAFRSLVAGLRAERYELALDLQRIAKSALVARLSGAPRVLGFDRVRTKEGAWLFANERIAAADPGAHMVEQYLEFARHLGVPRPALLHRFPPDAEADAWAERTTAILGGAPIAVAVGATKPANRWAPGRFGAVAAQLASGGLGPVCLIGAASDAAAASVALSAASGVKRVHDLTGRTTLRQMVALLSRSRLLIGCDTGPMHVAAALGTPVVALFGPADPRRTGPFGGGHVVVRVPPPCSPCNRRTCNQPRHACMEDITVAMVADAARRTLA
jgi:lipopolysaccharide heptosyltransferase II